MTKEDLVFQMGNPKSSMSMKGNEILFYPNNVKIIIKNEKVTAIKGISHEFVNPDNNTGAQYEQRQTGIWKPDSKKGANIQESMVEEVNPESVKQLMGALNDSQSPSPTLDPFDVEGEQEEALPQGLVDEIAPENVPESIQTNEFIQSNGEIIQPMAMPELSPEVEAYLSGDPREPEPTPVMEFFILGLLMFFINIIAVKLACKFNAVEVFWGELCTISGINLVVYLSLEIMGSAMGIADMMDSFMIYDSIALLISFPLIKKFTSATTVPTIIKVVLASRVISILIVYLLQIFVLSMLFGLFFTL